MAKINRRVASMILLAALDYKAGNRSGASQRLLKASEDPDFDETIDGMSDATDQESDPFLNPEQAESEGDESEGEGDEGDDADLNLEGLDDLLGDKEGEQASLARTAKQRRTTAAEDDKLGGNEGPTGAEKDNDSDEEIRQETASVARLKQTRANLLALAAVR